MSFPLSRVSIADGHAESVAAALKLGITRTESEPVTQSNPASSSTSEKRKVQSTPCDANTRRTIEIVALIAALIVIGIIAIVLVSVYAPVLAVGLVIAIKVVASLAIVGGIAGPIAFIMINKNLKKEKEFVSAAVTDAVARTRKNTLAQRKGAAGVTRKEPQSRVVASGTSH